MTGLPENQRGGGSTKSKTLPNTSVRYYSFSKYFKLTNLIHREHSRYQSSGHEAGRVGYGRDLSSPIGMGVC